MPPLVTVVCLCYNHARFIREALDSVLNQTYPNLEIIVVDDFSTDNSREIIEAYVRKFPQIRYLPTEKNLGNCAAFNRAFEVSKGEYLIDFATDDILLPDRISEQVKAFEALGPEYGVIYTDAERIDDTGRHLDFYYKRDPEGNLLRPVHSGNVFAEVIARHFICTPTMIMRREVFESLGGYDEKLAYEDFDFWVRSSRNFKYFFLDKVLTRRRIHAHQMSSGWYKPHDKQLLSTIKVCYKALNLCREPGEFAALLFRVKFEIRQAVFSANYPEAEQLFELYRKLEKPKFIYRVLEKINTRRLNLVALRKFYQQIRH